MNKERLMTVLIQPHVSEKAATVTAFVERALAFYAAHGIVAKRLMTDG